MSSKSSQRRSQRGEYIETDTGNKISRRAKIEGTAHIMLGGRVVVQADTCLRGDLCALPSSNTNTTSSNDLTSVTDKEKESNTRTSITIGRYVVLSTRVVIHPPHRILKGGEVAYYRMKIGDHVFIGQNAYIEAASIGSHVHIGANVVVGNGCIIKDVVKILDGSVLAPGMVVPSEVVVGGRPARILGDLHHGWGVGSADAKEGQWVEGGDLREFVRSIH